MENEEKKEKKPAGKLKIKWWLWVIIILVIIAIALSFISQYLTRQKANEATLTAKPDTKSEITVKQYLSSLRGDIVRYHDTNKTYEGWTPNVTAVEDVKKIGSEIKTKSLGKDTYVIYAEMPETKTIFCIDHTNFTGEIVSANKISKTCQ